MAPRVVPLLDETLYLFDQTIRDNTLRFIINTFLVAVGYHPLYIDDLSVDKEILSRVIQTFYTVELTSANKMIYVHSPYLDLLTLKFFIDYKTAYRISLMNYKIR